MANNVNDIMESFDFTDSIVTEVRWEENLLDLVVVVDYYWDVQDGRDDTRLLKIIFKNCVKADFQIGKELPLSNNEINKESLFTIVLFKEKTESEFNTGNQKHMELFTTDYSIPWLTVICSEVMLEEQ
ncbi:hypothetical protein [Paenibacillus tyrfis]|uniref:hypothetical protein n=1 Tax=Paenibacillus tyrfis TaxID=1501230 RepID=UPI00190F6EB2|nr:hypothetical protein [Paenibacillus tyrfis]